METIAESPAAPPPKQNLDVAPVGADLRAARFNRAGGSDAKSSPRQQVKSRARVRNHGEVFTAEREVKAMCDLVRDDSFNPDSTFLEPACGTGNFLIEILSRKLETVSSRYRRRQFDWETHSLQALGTLYGVDILGDNVAECRNRLFDAWDAEYARLFKSKKSEDVRRSARFILACNIVRGNALSLKLVDDSATDTDEPIVFSQWKLHSGAAKMRREEFSFAHLLEKAEDAKSTVPDAVPGSEALLAATDGLFLGSKLYSSRRVFDE